MAHMHLLLTMLLLAPMMLQVCHLQLALLLLAYMMFLPLVRAVAGTHEVAGTH